MPIAYIGGVLIVIALYVLIVMVVIGHLGLAEVAKVSDHVLSVAAGDIMGRAGYIAIVIANVVPLEAIATMGSAGFLLLFMAVNIAAVRLARETGGRAWISALAAFSTAVALIVLCVEVDENPATRNHLWILLGMILVSFAIELAYRSITGRQIHLLRNAHKE